jgi:uncharacterized protein (DUF1697 family)
MNTYIALLRGINVSGQKMIKMEALRSIFESMGYQEVNTYIQSGNVIFKGKEKDPQYICEAVEQGLAAALGYSVPVIIRTVDELSEVIEKIPFDLSLLTDKERVYVSLLSEKPAHEAIEALNSVENEIDTIKLIGREVYILCRKGYGESQFSNNFLEKKLKVRATTSNWTSVNKIYQLAVK